MCTLNSNSGIYKVDAALTLETWKIAVQDTNSCNQYIFSALNRSWGGITTSTGAARQPSQRGGRRDSDTA